MYQFALDTIAENFESLERNGFRMPYYLDRGTGRSSERILVSNNLKEVQGKYPNTVIKSKRPNGEILYMNYGISNQPSNVCAALDTLFNKYFVHTFVTYRDI